MFFSYIQFFYMNLLLLFRTVTKIFKAGVKSSKEESSPPPVPAKQLPSLQSRTSNTQQLINTSLARTNSMSKSMIVPNNDSSPMIHTESIPESQPTKISMSASSHGTLTSKDEQKEANQSPEHLTSSPSQQPPPILFRSGKTAIGTRVLPAIDPNGEAPPVKLRPFISEKKGRYSIELILYIYFCNF